MTDNAKALENRLRKNLRRLQPWARQNDVSCYRLYDRDIPAIPIALDRYGDHLVVQVYEPRHGLADAELLSWLLAIETTTEVPSSHTHVKRRSPTVGGTAYQSRADDVINQSTVVSEAGASFLVQLDAHIDVGLFLDHRPLRLAVRRSAAGRRMLNLFAYTAAFSVHAALGGAVETVSVDLVEKTTQWANDNLRLNQLDVRQHRVVCQDARDFLTESGAQFDIIVIDPPTVSKSARAASFEVQRDHTQLLALAARVLAPGGVIHFSTNFTRFQFSAPASLAATETTKATVPIDFTHVPVPHRSWQLMRSA